MGLCQTFQGYDMNTQLIFKGVHCFLSFPLPAFINKGGQARRKVLKSGGARCTKSFLKSEFLGKFAGVFRKNRGYTCTPGTLLPPALGGSIFMEIRYLFSYATFFSIGRSHALWLDFLHHKKLFKIFNGIKNTKIFFFLNLQSCDESSLCSCRTLVCSS